MSQPRSSNQQLVSFPFPPYLAHFLFYSLTNEVLKTPDSLIRHMDVDLRSTDGFFLRTLMERADFPNIKKVDEGFRITISVPREPRYWEPVMQDGRYSELYLPPKTIEAIIKHYETRFLDNLAHFIAGACFGNGFKRGSIEPAIKYWMEVYHLHEAGFTLDQFKKFYNRANLPVKKNVYAKSSAKNPFELLKKPGKALIDRYIKK